MTPERSAAPSSPADRAGAALHRILRTAILTAAGNPSVAGVMRRHGMHLGAARFVAGETIDDAVSILRRLNNEGFRTNTTLLGEHVESASDAEVVVDAYREIVDRIADEALTTNVALKLTHLGLDLGEPVAYANVRTIVSHAAQRDVFVRIDMEESSRVDATLTIYRKLRGDGIDQVGTVLQSSLYRTPADLESLIPLEPNLRLVKGAYLEPVDVAYPRKADVDAAYVRLAERMLRTCPFTAIATHDERIIEHVIGFTRLHHIDPSRFEFQMLYGIRPHLQRQLVDHGYRVLVATPYGPDWYPYLMRRLAERPANLLFLLSNVFRA